MDNIVEYIKNPIKIFNALTWRGGFNWMSDSQYLKLRYKMTFGKELDLNNPQTFNEKLQWLKLHDRNPLYTTLVDKYAVRDYIKEKLGEEYLIPLVGGPWTNARNIDFDKLPNQFVLKCTHDSGSVVICRDKKNFDIRTTVKKLNKALKRNFYYSGREWPYKNVKPQIIVEKYMQNDLNDYQSSDIHLEGQEITDYKFYCFDGQVHSVMVCVDRHRGSPKFYFFDKNWRLLRINKLGMKAASDFSLNKPANMDKMFEIAGILSSGIPHVRVDLYDVNNKIYFGEMTFYSDSGFDTNLLSETDKMWGRMINTRRIRNENSGISYQS